MDYIRWELERQKQALAVLLHGKSYLAAEREETTVQQANRTRKTWTQGEVNSYEPAREAEGPFGDGERHTADGLREEPREILKERITGIHRMESAMGRHADGETTEAHYTRNMMPNTFTAESKPEIRGISRAVQRDARRYDGGFSIY